MLKCSAKYRAECNCTCVAILLFVSLSNMFLGLQFTSGAAFTVRLETSPHLPVVGVILGETARSTKGSVPQYLYRQPLFAKQAEGFLLHDVLNYSAVPSLKWGVWKSSDFPLLPFSWLL